MPALIVRRHGSEALRAKLAQRRAVLAAAIEYAAVQTDVRRGQVKLSPNLNDAALRRMLRAQRFARVHRELHELLEINAALERIQAGLYGRCTECGKRIAATRLRALPTTQRCGRCAAIRGL